MLSLLSMLGLLGRSILLSMRCGRVLQERVVGSGVGCCVGLRWGSKSKVLTAIDSWLCSAVLRGPATAQLLSACTKAYIVGGKKIWGGRAILSKQTGGA